MPIFPTHLYADADPSPPLSPSANFQFQLTACGGRVLRTSVIKDASELDYVDCQSCRRTRQYRRIARQGVG